MDKSKLHIDLFFSKYPFNNQSTNNKEIVYEGKISDCNHFMVNDPILKINPKHKYIRIWKEKS